jgi:hypothetical protein
LRTGRLNAKDNQVYARSAAADRSRGAIVSRANLEWIAGHSAARRSGFKPAAWTRREERSAMMPQWYAYLGAVILLLSLGRALWRRPAKGVDWELIVAFIRLEFPPHQRDAAQKLAAGLAEILGLKIKELRPEHTLQQIADSAQEQIKAKDLIKILQVAYGVRCFPETTFRAVVEAIVETENSRGRRGQVHS